MRYNEPFGIGRRHEHCSAGSALWSFLPAPRRLRRARAIPTRRPERSRRQGRAHRPRQADLRRPRRMHHFAYRERRAPCRGRQPAHHRRGRRHAVLLLFDRHPRAPLPRLRRGLRRPRSRDLLFDEGQFQPGGDQDAGRPGRRHRRRLGGRAAPGAGARRAAAARSSSPASARPRARWRSASRTASPASTSNPSPSSSS